MLLSKHFQNAWETRRPEEFVVLIDLEIPPGADVVNPAEDAAFIKRIGAKRVVDDDASVADEYELKNAVTGTRFTFKQHPTYSVYYSRWILKKEE